MSRDRLLKACVAVIKARHVLEGLPDDDGTPGWHGSKAYIDRFNAGHILNERWRDLYSVLREIPLVGVGEIAS